MRDITSIIVHCSATPPSMDIGVAEITDWHVNGNGWSDIGYHWVIRRDGAIEAGRPEYTAGAHASGYNDFSLGICLVGGVDEQGVAESNYTDEQWTALETLIRDRQNYYGVDDDSIIGHRDLPDVAKACPCFDVIPWWESVQIGTPVPDTGSVVVGESRWFRIAFGDEIYEGSLEKVK